MTNPDNAVGTNAAYGGRTSVNAFNDDLAVYSRGILSGWECVPNTGMTVSLGGSGTTRDVAVAEDNAGNKTTINNISASPIDVALGAAPASNSRIDLIVAYVDNPPQGTSTIADNYEACGIIAVQGTASSSPTAPNDSAIRTAITADGASGTTAYYVILASVTIANGTTDIVADNIRSGVSAHVSPENLASYQSGDTLTIGGGTTGASNIDYVVCAGLLTSSRGEMVFSLTLPHLLSDISSVTLDSSKVYIRHINGGYVLQGVDLVTASTSMNIGIVSDNTITISAVKTGGWTDGAVANNTPLVVEGGFNFTFN